VFHFGHDRPCETRRITFQIAGASTSTPAGISAAIVGDLLSSDGGKTIPYSETGVTAPTRDANGNYSISFGIGARHEGSGDYLGLLQIAAPGAKPLSIPIEVTLRSSPAWAISWLVLGLLLGYLLKWWAASGSVLEKQVPRLDLVDRRLRDIPSSVLPPELTERRDDAERAIANWDADAAKAALDDLQTRLEAIVGVSVAAERLLDRLDALKAGSLRGSGSDIDALAGEIRTAARASWVDAAKALATINGLGDRVTKLEVYAATATQHDTVAAIARGEVIAVAATPEAETQQAVVPARVVKAALPRTSRRIALQRQVLRRMGAVLFLITLIALTFYGYATQYDKKPTFGAAELSDWITLGGWGFATALAGKTIVDYFGPGVPTSSPTPAPTAPPTPPAVHTA
jgi:hypothetical protein